MYTLRIIDQTHNGAEERKNILFEGEYSVLMKIPESCDKSGIDEPRQTNRFDEALNEYFTDGVIDDRVVGFVYINNTSYPIKNSNVVYIVGTEGQTVERIYGVYNKY